MKDERRCASCWDMREPCASCAVTALLREEPVCICGHAGIRHETNYEPRGRCQHPGCPCPVYVMMPAPLSAEEAIAELVRLKEEIHGYDEEIKE